MNTVYRKKGKTVTRRLTFKKADVVFFKKGEEIAKNSAEKLSTTDLA